MVVADGGLSAEYRTLYEAHYNRSVLSWDGDVDVGLGNVSNATMTTPSFTLQPLNLTAIMLETAPVINIVHEPFQHDICHPHACLTCPRSLPNDSMSQLAAS